MKKLETTPQGLSAQRTGAVFVRALHAPKKKVNSTITAEKLFPVRGGDAPRTVAASKAAPGRKQFPAAKLFSDVFRPNAAQLLSRSSATTPLNSRKGR